MTTTQKAMKSLNLRFGKSIVWTSSNNAEIRACGLPLCVEFRGTLRACKSEAKRRGLLMSQAK